MTTRTTTHPAWRAQYQLRPIDAPPVKDLSRHSRSTSYIEQKCRIFLWQREQLEGSMCHLRLNVLDSCAVVRIVRGDEPTLRCTFEPQYRRKTAVRRSTGGHDKLTSSGGAISSGLDIVISSGVVCVRGCTRNRRVIVKRQKVVMVAEMGTSPGMLTRQYT